MDSQKTDTSIYKTDDNQASDPLQQLEQVANTAKTLSSLKNQKPNSGGYGEPSGNTVDRLGAGTPYGQTSDQ